MSTRRNRRLQILPAGLIAVSLMAGCSSDDDSPVVTPVSPVVIPTPSSYQKIVCSDVIDQALLDQGLLGDDTVECGFVTVAADWQVPDGDKLKLAVYKIPSTSSSPASDPVVYLEGGPGGAGAPSVAEFATGQVAYLRSRSDVYVIDQRGTGFSEPALYCPEVFQAEKEEKEGDELLAAYQACHDRFVGEGVAFKDYNSRNNALDVKAVREALEIEQWNLYGLSYGTRLALTVMRDAPQGVRSVILDSVFPPEVNGFSEADYPFYFSINQIATNCSADADCKTNIGDIKSAIERGVSRLDAQPVAGLTARLYLETLSENIADPETAQGIAVVADGSDEELTQLINELDADDEGNEPEVLPADVEPALYPFVAEAAEAMFYAVVCAEESPYLDSKAGPDVAADFSETTQRVVNGVVSEQLDGTARICDLFAVPAAGIVETEAVRSDIPTLVLAGTADQVTPPAWSILADDALDHSQYAEFDGLTHGLIGNNSCLNDITLAFLAQPAVTADQACILDLPRVDYVTE